MYESHTAACYACLLLSVMPHDSDAAWQQQMSHLKRDCTAGTNGILLCVHVCIIHSLYVYVCLEKRPALVPTSGLKSS